MKFFTLVMTILIFVSGFDLCAEVTECDSENTIELSKSDPQQKSDTCTPFCHCGHCVFSIILPEIIKEKNIGAISVDSFKSSQRVLVSQVSFSIWQPPKLA